MEQGFRVRESANLYLIVTSFGVTLMMETEGNHFTSFALHDMTKVYIHEETELRVFPSSR